ILSRLGSLGLELEQNELSWTKPVNKRVDIKCRVTGLQTTYVHWYHQKDGEALVRMLYMDQSGSNPVYNPDHPEAKDFTVRRQGDVYFIKTNAVKKEHEGGYYCACWDSSHSDSNCSHPLQ
uniref:Immunoglobulin V-set domain-containing protein n=1 Tax=Astyanax mexicanus TaxID=7994 RepID=A0A8B9J4E1_ASTMX